MKIETYERRDQMSILLLFSRRLRPDDPLVRIVSMGMSFCPLQWLIVLFCIGGGSKRGGQVDLCGGLLDRVKGKTLKRQRTHPTIP
jgi:hypothetical protein